MRPITRNRPLYAFLVVLVIGFGLFWRSGYLPLHAVFWKYGGDALWALVAFLGLGFLWPRVGTVRIGLAALGFAWAIEFSQLYHAPWIDGIRATLPGRLILGSTFHAPDLIAYGVGIALGVFGESCYWGTGAGRLTGTDSQP